jgi:hypothetical protein
MYAVSSVDTSGTHVAKLKFILDYVHVHEAVVFIKYVSAIYYRLRLENINFIGTTISLYSGNSGSSSGTKFRRHW